MARVLLANVALLALTVTSVSFIREVGGGVRRGRPPRVAAGFSVFARAMRIPDERVGVPVLTYHGIADHQGRYSVSPRRFAEQLAMLRGAGFHSVSLAQLEAVYDGKRPRLPSRPILLTFDDGVNSAWTAADPILARYGFRAVMFVITSRVAAHSPSYYLTWAELRAMRESGRWEFGSHSHDQHVVVALAGGSRGPALDNRVLLSSGRAESIVHWRHRITQDLDLSRRLLREHLGISTRAFAYPLSATGDPTNDPRISSELGDLVTERFPIAFTNVDHGPAVVTPWTRLGRLPRTRVGATTTAVELLTRLRAEAEGIYASPV